MNFNEPDVGLWKGVKAAWALALREALPKNLDEYKGLQQNELFLGSNDSLARLDSYEDPFQKGYSFNHQRRWQVRTLEQRDTMLEKSIPISNEEKLSADTRINTIPIDILTRPSPIKEYRYNEFEGSGRLSRN